MSRFRPPREYLNATERRAAVQEAAMKAKSIAELAEMTGLSEPTVRKYVKELPESIQDALPYGRRKERAVERDMEPPVTTKSDVVTISRTEAMMLLQVLEATDAGFFKQAAIDFLREQLRVEK